MDRDHLFICGSCGETMLPEHSHYRCPECGWVEGCCEGSPR